MAKYWGPESTTFDPKCGTIITRRDVFNEDGYCYTVWDHLELMGDLPVSFGTALLAAFKKHNPVEGGKIEKLMRKDKGHG